jgi:site-specific recombinase XerD
MANQTTPDQRAEAVSIAVLTEHFSFSFDEKTVFTTPVHWQPMVCCQEKICIRLARKCAAFAPHVLSCSSVRDRAIALLLFYTGLRISECASLTLDDVRLSSRK